MLLMMDYPRASVSPTQYRGIAGSGDEIGKMAANMREATCARTKTSKVPTRVALLYLSYSVVYTR